MNFGGQRNGNNKKRERKKIKKQPKAPSAAAAAAANAGFNDAHSHCRETGARPKTLLFHFVNLLFTLLKLMSCDAVANNLIVSHRLPSNEKKTNNVHSGHRFQKLSSQRTLHVANHDSIPAAGRSHFYCYN